MQFTFHKIKETNYKLFKNATIDFSMKRISIPDFINLENHSKSKIEFKSTGPNDPIVNLHFYHDKKHVSWELNIQGPKDAREMVKLLTYLKPKMNKEECAISRYNALTKILEICYAEYNAPSTYLFSDIQITKESLNQSISTDSSNRTVELPKFYSDKSDRKGASVQVTDNSLFVIEFVEKNLVTQWRINIHYPEDRLALIDLFINISDSDDVNLEKIYYQYLKIELDKEET